MSCRNDVAAIPPKQYHLLDLSSSRRPGSSTRARHSRICSSTSLPPYGCSSQFDLDNPDPLDPSSDTSLDSDLDRRTASSATLLSPSSESNISARLSESRKSSFLFALPEPGQMTVQRTHQLRARIASVIMSIPATCEDVGDLDKDEPCEVEALPIPRKLRRVPGVRDLRRAFRDGDHEPTHFSSVSSLGLSKASHELGILPTPTLPESSEFGVLPTLIPLESSLSLRPSLRTLVDLGIGLPKSTSDLKTLCGSTLSSVSVSSRTTTKVHSIFPPSRSSFTRLPSDASQSIFPRKLSVHNSSIPQSHRRISLQLQPDVRSPRSSGELVWSCAKISQSSVKLAARRGHTPRRVFSSPTAVLSP